MFLTPNSTAQPDVSSSESSSESTKSETLKRGVNPEDMAEIDLNDKDDANAKTPTTKEWELPESEQVYMGAGLSKIFYNCPLHINHTASWNHKETRQKFLLIAADEGLYTYNLSQMHDLEGAMVQVHKKPAYWLYVIEDVLMSVSGENNIWLYRHDLNNLHRELSGKGRSLGRSVTHKLAERNILPKSMRSPSAKVPDTKGCDICSAIGPDKEGDFYLAANLPERILLFQWYHPPMKFLLLKTVPKAQPVLYPLFQLVLGEERYPQVGKKNGDIIFLTVFSLQVVVGVHLGVSDDSDVLFDMIDLNSASSSDSTTLEDSTNDNADDSYDPHRTLTHSNGSNASSSIFHSASKNISGICQLMDSSIVIAHGRCVKLVDHGGHLKLLHRKPMMFNLDYNTVGLVRLSDGSILVLHKHGLHGRDSRDFQQVTQNLIDASRVYRLLGSDRLVVLESRSLDNVEDTCDLQIVTGHDDVNF